MKHLLFGKPFYNFGMFTIYRPGTLTVIAATIIVYVWAIALLIEPQYTASLAGMMLLFKNHFVAGAINLFAASCATYALFRSDTFHPIKTTLLYLPQQIMLFLASISSLNCVMSQQFADEITRVPTHDYLFILTGETLEITLCYLHLIAVICMAQDKEHASP